MYKAIGTSGNMGTLTMHDSGMVGVSSQRRAMRGKDIHLISPFAGKTFCFDRWKSSVRTLPIDRIHATLYDNSNDPRFHDRLTAAAKSLFSSYTIVQDRNRTESIDIHSDVSEVLNRCSQVYQEIHTNYSQPKMPWVLNLEDDIGVPDYAFERLEAVMLAHDEVGTVIGRCRDRRAIAEGTTPESISVNFVRHESVGGPLAEDTRVEVNWAPERPWGVEAIGSGHMGFWLTRTEAIEYCGMVTCPKIPILGQDIQWGYRLNNAGYRFAIDWSVGLEHYFQKDGKVLSC